MKKIMKIAVMFTVALLGGTAVFANDGRAVLAGSAQIVIVDDKKTNVAMQEEEIIISLHKDYYEVDVSFKFYNNGPDEKILVAFPVTLSGSGVTSKGIEEAKKALLKSYANGKLLSPDEYKIKEEYDYGGYSIYRYIASYTKWLLRDIEFKSKSNTESRVVYRVPYSNDRGYDFAGYTYGTGRTWKGPIGKMTIIVNHDDDVVIDKLSLTSPQTLLEPVPTWVANGKYKYALENINPETNKDVIEIPVHLFRYGIYGEYGEQFECSEYGHFHCRFDCWYECEDELEQAELEQAWQQDKLPGSYSWHWHKALIYKDPSEIRLLTKNQIRLFINFFFARHGYDFKNQQYKNYFQKMKSTGLNGFKYKVNPKFKESDFNEIERKNIDYLLKLEKMIPKDSTTK